MRLWILLIAWVGRLMCCGGQMSDPGGVQIDQISNNYTFGVEVLFRAHVQSTLPIREALLYVQSEGRNTQLERVPVDVDGKVNYRYDIRKNPLRPFAPTVYWYQVTLDGESQFKSPKYTFDYIDNRFNWLKLDDDIFDIRYLGDQAFGEMVLNVAQSGLRSAQSYLPLQPERRHLKIFVYSSVYDLQSALELSQSTWVGGHASPDLGVIAVAAPPSPDQRLDLERKIPHELMHLLQYQVMGKAYYQMPVWLSEGLASLAELYPSPDYQRFLQEASNNHTLLPMASLCDNLPVREDQVYLSYAQSASFVRFIHQSYGTSGLQRLLDTYKDGVGCKEGVQSALGTSLSQMEYRWRQESLGIDATWLAFKNLLPYAMLGGFLLVVLLLVFVLQAKLLKRDDTNLEV